MVTSTRRVARRPPRFNSLVAAAQVITAPNQALQKVSAKSADWQMKAWDYFNDVGEFRAGVGWLANGLSRVNLVSAAAPTLEGDEPTPIGELLDKGTDDGEAPQLPVPEAVLRRAQELVAQLGGGPIGQGQMLGSFATHLTVAGESWLIAEPGDDPTDDELSTWAVVADKEVRNKVGGNGLQIVGDDGAWRDLHAKALTVRCWRRHPAARSEADSPIRALLSTLSEIQLLSEHIIATAVSRLAGNGLLLMPSEATFAPSQIPKHILEQMEEGEIDDADVFVATFTAAGTAPIADRGVASAVIPLVALMPGELIKNVQHLRFNTAFDERVMALREAGIKRFALGIDMPPEVLLGVGGMNHWGAWAVAEEAITLHLEPLAELACHAWTIGYLVPALIGEFPTVDADVIRNGVMVWYDTSDLTARPDKSKQVVEAYDRIEASGKALRREMGLSEDDRPDDDEKRERILLQVAKGAPTLAPAMLAEAGFLDPAVADAADAAAPAPSADGGPPADQESIDNQGPPPDGPNAALLAYADGIVFRAMERAGARIRAAATKGHRGGAAALPCDRLDRLHLTVRNPEMYVDPDRLTAGSWDRVDEVADRCGIDRGVLARDLIEYTHTLLTMGLPHHVDRLNAALTQRSALTSH